MQRILLSFAIIATLISFADATNHTVGAPNGGWDQFTNLQTWASSQTFSPGDNLLFQHTSSFHNLLEVSKANYDSCATSNPLNPPYAAGSTVIHLTNPGKRYFICGIPGHCAAGMKIEVNTIAALALPPAIAPPPLISADATVPPVTLADDLPRTMPVTASSPVSSLSPSPIPSFPSTIGLPPAESFPVSATTLSSATKFGFSPIGFAFLMVILLNV